ncbi:MAG: hypothetical protein MUP41_15245 [Desulfobacterales bacterium]|nr:hypothetical protein [Desulfobacterales bacterium]
MDKTTDRMRPEQAKLTLVKKRDIGYFCQYTTMTDIGRELNRIEKFYQFLLRVYPAIQRRIRRWRDKFPQKSDRRVNREIIINECQPEDSSGDTLKIGDMVKVLSYSQIRSTLNDRGVFKNLKFQQPMEKYCNNTYEVLRIPQYVLNNGGRKINKCKDVVILRGLYCNGKGMMTHEGCDMCCLHYWKTDWLKKIV